MEERRQDILTSVATDVKQIMSRQHGIHEEVKEIKEQVKKTNGRVTELEKFMWSVVGGAAIFGVFNLPSLVRLIVR